MPSTRFEQHRRTVASINRSYCALIKRVLQGNIRGGVLAAFFPFCALSQGSRRAVYAPRVKTRPCERGECGSRCLEAGSAVWAPALVPTSVALARRSANLSLLGFPLFALFCSVLYCFGLCFLF